MIGKINRIETIYSGQSMRLQYNCFIITNLIVFHIFFTSEMRLILPIISVIVIHHAQEGGMQIIVPP